jgi:hypothetical protein
MILMGNSHGYSIRDGWSDGSIACVDSAFGPNLCLSATHDGKLIFLVEAV